MGNPLYLLELCRSPSEEQEPQNDVSREVGGRQSAGQSRRHQLRHARKMFESGEASTEVRSLDKYLDDPSPVLAQLAAFPSIRRSMQGVSRRALP